MKVLGKTLPKITPGRVLLVVAATPVVVIILMQLSTNSLMREMEGVFLSKQYHITQEEYDTHTVYYETECLNYVICDPDTPNLQLYNTFAHTAQAVRRNMSYDVRTELNLSRMMAWHNFSEGKVWVYYYVSVYDWDGNLILTRASGGDNTESGATLGGYRH